MKWKTAWRSSQARRPATGAPVTVRWWGMENVEILSDHYSKQQGLEVIMAQHGAPELTEFNQKNLNRMVILKIRITSMSGKRSSNY